jgi:hypothetical protein
MQRCAIIIMARKRRHRMYEKVRIFLMTSFLFILATLATVGWWVMHHEVDEVDEVDAGGSGWGGGGGGGQNQRGFLGSATSTWRGSSPVQLERPRGGGKRPACDFGEYWVILHISGRYNVPDEELIGGHRHERWTADVCSRTHEKMLESSLLPLYSFPPRCAMWTDPS